MELPLLEEYLNNLRNKEEFLNIDLTTQVCHGKPLHTTVVVVVVVVDRWSS